MGTLQVGQVLSAEQLDEFISAVSGVLAKGETREHLTHSLQERLEGYLGSDTPIEKILPAELRDVLHDRLQREIPEILERIARWLRDPENVESLVERILKALEAYAGQANWLKSLITNLGLHFFREEITQALHQRIPRLAREYLHSEEVREQIARQLLDSVNALLRKPVVEVVGDHRHVLAQRVGSITATWISSVEAQEALGSFLRHQYHQHSKRQLDEVVPERVRRTMRQRLSKALRLPRDKIEPWSVQLSAFLRERLQHSHTPLREWTGLRQDDEQALVQWTQEKATKLLEANVPVLIERFDIQRHGTRQDYEVRPVTGGASDQGYHQRPIALYQFARGGTGGIGGCTLAVSQCLYRQPALIGPLHPIHIFTTRRQFPFSHLQHLLS